MASRTRVGIAGTGAYLPERIVPNSWFEGFLDTSDEWITQRTGIRNRRYAADDEATSDLCVKASERALEAAELEPDQIDLVICGTLTGDYVIPSTACLIQDRMGMKNAGAFDVNSACTGFLTAMHTGEAFISAGRAKNVLVLGAETLSRYVDLKDRSSCVIFGDGAGAAILSPLEDCGRGEILRTTLGADGSGWEFIHIEAGGSRHPTTMDTVKAGKQFIRMRGRDVFRFAVTQMSRLISQMLEEHEPDELSLVVPHQVNRRIIVSAVERLEIPLDKVIINIQDYANTSAGTVPIALDQAVREDRLEKGKLVVLVAFGAGLTWGASLLRW